MILTVSSLVRKPWNPAQTSATFVGSTRATTKVISVTPKITSKDRSSRRMMNRATARSHDQALLVIQPR
jgi:hypothetical protein